MQSEVDKALRSKVAEVGEDRSSSIKPRPWWPIDVNTGRYVGREDRWATRRHDSQDQPGSGEGNRSPDSTARPRRHHRARLHRYGGEEPPEGVPGGRAGAAQGSRALEAVAGVRLRLVIITQTGQAEPRTCLDRALPVLGAGTIKSSSTICYEILSEVKKVGSDLDGPGVLLRVNPDIARASRRRAQCSEGPAAHAGQGRHREARRPSASRAVRFDVNWRVAPPASLAAPQVHGPWAPG